MQYDETTNNGYIELLKNITEINYEYKTGEGYYGPGSFHKVIDPNTVIVKTPAYDDFNYITVKLSNSKLDKTIFIFKGEDIINIDKRAPKHDYVADLNNITRPPDNSSSVVDSKSTFSYQLIIILLVILAIFIVIIKKFVIDNRTPILLKN